MMAIFLLIFFLLLTVYGLLVDFYRRTWKKIPLHIPLEDTNTRVTVVVAARNEEKNLQVLLDCLNKQRYPSDCYEVIVVDDHSTDNTLAFLEKSTASFSWLRVFSLPEGTESKKMAIAKGVAEASGELIITTDADCTMLPGWIHTIASFHASTNAAFIAAPVRMIPGKSPVGVFQTLDFLGLQGLTGASVHKKFHTMCNGANLAYTKAAFEEVSGFEGINDIPSGDDMLLMHKIYKLHPRDVRYLKSVEAIVSTPAQRGLAAMLHQRIRWASKAVHYKDRRLFLVLLLTLLVNAGFIFMGVAVIADQGWLAFFLLLLLAKIVIEFPFVNAAAIFFKQRWLMVWFPLFQPLHILYIVATAFLGRFGSYKWKSRVVKNKGLRKRTTP